MAISRRNTLILVGAAGLQAAPGAARAQALDLAAALAPRSFGAENAPITVIEYFSMTCPHCAAFHVNTLPRVKKDLIEAGRCRYTFRDFPLDRVALAAHMIARALPASAWYDFVGVLMATQSQWATSRDPVGEIAKLASMAGMGRPAFDAALANEQLQRGVLAERLTGEQQDRVEGTPTFIASSGRRASGDISFERFLELAGGPWPPAAS
ncbi:MAG: DsbA family protein [Acetobacteraceae bacterium]|nr:DsbA family protein [Acetobacteraceae bacterium]